LQLNGAHSIYGRGKLISVIPKIILPHRFDGEPAATFYTEPAALTKTAFSTNDELSSFMSGFTKKKDHGYVLVCALGAYEAHGPNNNFDSFDIPNLIPQHQNARRPYGISTFVTHGRVYRSHNNKSNCLAISTRVNSPTSNRARTWRGPWVHACRPIAAPGAATWPQPAGNTATT
jgi:hypothetical protein